MIATMIHRERRPLSLVLLPLLSGVLVYGTYWTVRRWTALPPYLSFIGPLLLSVGFGYAVQAALLRRKSQQIARVLADRGYCGSCAYALNDLAVEHDRCRVCPECASAWRFSEAGASTTDRELVEFVAKRFAGKRRWIKDDRGVRVPAITPTLLMPETGEGGPIPLGTRHEINRRWRAAVLPVQKRLVKAFMIVPLSLLVVFLALSLHPRSPLPLTWILPVGLLLVMAATMVVTGIVSRRWQRRLVRGSLLELGHCPSCGTALRRTQEGADERTACPACSAEWRLPREAEAVQGHFH